MTNYQKVINVSRASFANNNRSVLFACLTKKIFALVSWIKLFKQLYV